MAAQQYRQLVFEQLKPIAQAIRAAIGVDCEVVIHDFSDLEHSIIWIEGSFTNRGVGGSLTDLGLHKVRTGDTEDLLNYTTYTDDGRTCKSSSIFLRDEQGEVFGALCINVDITPFLTFEHALHAFSERSDAQDVTETFSGEISDILETMFAETVRAIGKPVSLMSKEEKVSLVSILDDKGAFQVKKAVPFVAGRLGVSRITVYNYLNEAHEVDGAPAENSGPDRRSA